MTDENVVISKSGNYILVLPPDPKVGQVAKFYTVEPIPNLTVEVTNNQCIEITEDTEALLREPARIKGHITIRPEFLAPLCYEAWRVYQKILGIVETPAEWSELSDLRKQVEINIVTTCQNTKGPVDRDLPFDLLIYYVVIQAYTNTMLKMVDGAIQ